MTSEIKEMKTFKEILIKKFELTEQEAKENSDVFETEIEAITEYLEQFTPNYKQDFATSKEIVLADVRTEFISKLLRGLK